MEIRHTKSVCLCSVQRHVFTHTCTLYNQRWGAFKKGFGEKVLFVLGLYLVGKGTRAFWVKETILVTGFETEKALLSEGQPSEKMGELSQIGLTNPQG